MNDRTHEFVSLRNEENLKKNVIKSIMWCKLQTSNDCMLCGEKASTNYPLYFCDSCFTLMYNPKHNEYNEFTAYYYFYKSLNENDELKILLENMREKNDILYRNLRIAIMTKIKGLINIGRIKLQIRMLTTQVEVMKKDYRKILDKKDLDSIMAYKDSITRLDEEINILWDRLEKQKHD